MADGWFCGYNFYQILGAVLLVGPWLVDWKMTLCVEGPILGIIAIVVAVAMFKADDKPVQETGEGIEARAQRAKAAREAHRAARGA